MRGVQWNRGGTLRLVPDGDIGEPAVEVEVVVVVEESIHVRPRLPVHGDEVHRGALRQRELLAALPKACGTPCHRTQRIPRQSSAQA